jgi:1-deoxy-D-xylulose-5-phosphate reductoisomerase
VSCGIAILGATGSIGTAALEVVERLGEPYRVVALSGHSRTDLLLEQVRKFRPAAVCCSGEDVPAEVGREIEQLGARLYRGNKGLVELVRREDVQTVVAAVVGAAGLPAVIAAVEAGKRVALANKESLVIAGSIIMPLARRTGAEIIPVDSEHSAIFQAMQCGKKDEIRRVILTASGGPFRAWPVEKIFTASVKDALAHPTWRMGNKVTIDSATMFNKGLELIEACWLFGVRPEVVEIVIHPESVIHSMVEFVDGSVIAQLSPPDMRTPIQYAITYPNRVVGCSKKMDWTKAHELHFEPADFTRFPALEVAYDVAGRGGLLGATMNAANEVAVESFTSGKIAFGEIAQVVAGVVNRAEAIMSKGIVQQHLSDVQSCLSLDDLLKADRAARAAANREIESRKVSSPATAGRT